MKESVPYRFLRSFKTNSLTLKEFFAEFLGTFLLILMASSAGASNTLSGQLSNFSGAFSAGIGVFLAVLVSAKISGGHVNPIVTIAFSTVGKFPWKKVPIYILAQYSGAFLGTALIFANYYSDIDSYDGGHRHTFGKNSTGQIFTTFPYQHINNGEAFLDQTICAGILMMAVMMLVDERNAKVPLYVIPIFIGLVLTGLSISFGLNCGAALNPARDFSARIFLSMVGYGGDPFRPLDNLYWLIGGIIGPHVGGIVGAWMYMLLIELHHDNP